VMLVYLTILTKLIIFKKPLGYVKNYLLHHYHWQQVKANMHTANLVPFATIKLYWNARHQTENVWLNLWGNVIGFIPLGMMLPLLFKRLNSFVSTAFCVFLFSLAFEIFQLLTMLGIFDVDDLLLNTLGGAIGFILFWLLVKMGIVSKKQSLGFGDLGV